MTKWVSYSPHMYKNDHFTQRIHTLILSVFIIPNNEMVSIISEGKQFAMMKMEYINLPCDRLNNVPPKMFIS